MNFNQWTGWDFGGNSTYKGGNVNFSNQFKNYWYFNCGINIDLNNIDNSVLRGGPSMKIPGGWNYWFSVATDQRKKFTADAYASAYYGFDDWTANYNYGFDLSYKPWDALSITVNPDFSINKSGLQYIDTKNYRNAMERRPGRGVVPIRRHASMYPTPSCSMATKTCDKPVSSPSA